MIPHVRWSRRYTDEVTNPFIPYSKRPLKLTFHTASYTNLSDQEALALEALRDLAQFPEIESLETVPSSGSYLEIGDLDPSGDQILVRMRYEDGQSTLTSILFAGQWPRVAARIIGQPLVDPIQPEIQAMLDALLLAQAHIAAKSDILVTACPLLVNNLHKDSSIADANPRLPSEAAQLLGLFLRSRDIFKAGTDPRLHFSRWMYYWALTRHHLPDLWYYFNGCLAAERVIGGDIGELGGSILLRACHAIQSRDAIGRLFNLDQTHNTQDQTAYHFTYLTLVLSGALDSEARVAHRAYNLPGSERDAGFRKKAFLKAIHTSAPLLHGLVTSQPYKDVMTLVFEPRNRIHGAAFRALTTESVYERETWLTVPDDLAHYIWQAAERLGSPERWGLTRHHSVVCLEPYSYATALITEGLAAINAIARETDVTRLFPAGSSIPRLMIGAPEDVVFGEQSRKRLFTLG